MNKDQMQKYIESRIEALTNVNSFQIGLLTREESDARLLELEVLAYKCELWLVAEKISKARWQLAKEINEMRWRRAGVLKGGRG